MLRAGKCVLFLGVQVELLAIYARLRVVELAEAKRIEEAQGRGHPKLLETGWIALCGAWFLKLCLSLYLSLSLSLWFEVPFEVGSRDSKATSPFWASPDIDTYAYQQA